MARAMVKRYLDAHMDEMERVAERGWEFRRDEWIVGLTFPGCRQVILHLGPLSIWFGPRR